MSAEAPLGIAPCIPVAGSVHSALVEHHCRQSFAVTAGLLLAVLTLTLPAPAADAAADGLTPAAKAHAEALRLASDRKFDDALSLLDQADRDGLATPDLAAARVTILGAASRNAAAIAAYEALPPQVVRTREMRLALGRIYRVEKAFGKAKALYDELLKETPGDVEAERGLVLTQFDMGGGSTALKTVADARKPEAPAAEAKPAEPPRKAPEAAPAAEPPISVTEAHRLANGGKRAEALAAIERSLKTSPNKLGLLRLQAELAEADGNLPLAVSSNDQILEKLPGDDAASQANLRLLMTLARRATGRDAVELMVRAWRVSEQARAVAAECALLVRANEIRSDWRYDPAQADPGFSLALAGSFRELGQVQRAARYYRAILAARPGDRAAMSGLILALARIVEDPRSLLADVDLALLRSPADRELRVAKAEMLRRLGRADEALALCEAVLQSDPEHFDARCLKARLLVDRAGRTGSGLEPVEEAVRITGRAPDIVAEYIKALAGRDRVAEALQQFETLPDAFEVTADLLKSLGRCYRALDRPDAAALAYGTALERQADRGSGMTVLQWKAAVQGEESALHKR